MRGKWSIFFVCFIAGILSWIFSESMFHPLKIRLIKKGFIQPESSFFFSDLDGDGNDETLSTDVRNPGIIGLTINGEAYQVWQENFYGSFVPKKTTIITSNIDGDAFREVVVAFHRNDSVFLGVFEYGSFERIVDELFLAKISPKGDVSEDLFIRLDSHDLDGNDHEELIISLMVGYGRYPRRLFVYNNSEKKMYTTPDTWEAWMLDFMVCDLEQDGYMEILAYGSAPGNSKDTSITYHDHKSWLIAFDHELNKYPGEYAETCRGCDSKVIRRGTDYYQVIRRNHAAIKTLVRKINLNNGRLGFEDMVSSAHDFSIYEETFHSFSDKRNAVGATVHGVLDEQLNFHPLDDDGPVGRFFPLLLFDGDRKHFLIVNESGINIYNERLDVTHFPTPELELRRVQASAGRLNGQQLLAVSVHDQLLMLELSENPYILYRFLFIVCCTFGGGVVSYIGLLFFRYRKEARAKQLYALRIRALRNQIDPHYTLNLMGSIRLHLMKNDVLQAEELFDRFIRLLKYSLTNSEDISVSLEDELRQVRLYLEIENEQNDRLQSFDLYVEEGLEQMKMPRMLIQEHVENAIKHGIRHLDEPDGVVKVEVVSTDGRITVTIEDNGVGRGTRILKDSTRQGSQLSEELIRLFNKLENRNVKQTIEDLPRGTRVIITA